jgi:hypothetical protein
LPAIHDRLKEGAAVVLSTSPWRLANWPQSVIDRNRSGTRFEVVV